MENALPLNRLLQLCSSTLPIGNFTYSQGIEWAVECGWISNQQQLSDWLQDLISGPLTRLELPLLTRLYHAAADDDLEQLRYWSQWLLANRETAELRSEERNKGRALTTLLSDLELPISEPWREVLNSNQSAGFGFACARWQIPLDSSCHGFAWSWLENLTLAGVKLVPLGQTAGQRILHQLSNEIGTAVTLGLSLSDAQLGASAPAMALASSRHETQYTRLFRS